MKREQILILGFGGHAKSMVDAIEQKGIYKIAGFIDRKESKRKKYRCYETIGTDDDLELLFQSGIKNAAIGIGYLGKEVTREQLYRKLKEIGFCLPVICDPSAIIAKDVLIEEGTFIGKRAVLNSNSKIGKIAIINTGAIIEHDCYIGDGTHIAIGAAICGGVIVGRNCLIGANAVVIQGKQIEDCVCIGAGATVLTDIAENETVYGTVKRG